MAAEVVLSSRASFMGVETRIEAGNWYLDTRKNELQPSTASILTSISHKHEILSSKLVLSEVEWILNKFEGSNFQMTKIDSRFRGNGIMG